MLNTKKSSRGAPAGCTATQATFQSGWAPALLRQTCSRDGVATGVPEVAKVSRAPRSKRSAWLVVACRGIGPDVASGVSPLSSIHTSADSCSLSWTIIELGEKKKQNRQKLRTTPVLVLHAYSASLVTAAAHRKQSGRTHKVREIAQKNSQPSSAPSAVFTRITYQPSSAPASVPAPRSSAVFTRTVYSCVAAAARSRATADCRPPAGGFRSAEWA